MLRTSEKGTHYHVRIPAFALFFLILFLIISAQSFALELMVNGSPHRSYDPASFPIEPYRIALLGGGYASGHSLGELFPLFTGAYRMEIEWRGGESAGEAESESNSDASQEPGGESAADTETETEIIERDDIGDLLFNGAVVASSDSGRYDLIIGDKRYRGVRKIDVYGDRITEGSLTVWLSWEGVDELKAELRRFAEIQGVKVELVQVPNTETKLTATLRGGGDLPDLVMLQTSSVPDLTAARALQRLDYLETDYMVEKGRSAFRLEGKLWAVPFYFDAQMIFYNPELLSRRPSPDWTLSDFEELAGEVKERRPDVFPAAWNAYSAYWLSPFLHAFGKEELIDADGGIRIDDEATEKTLGYLKRLSERGLLEVSEREAMTGYFASGRSAIIMSGSYSIPHFRELGIPFEPVPFPVHGETGKAVAPFLDFKGFAITRRTRSPILARRFLQHLTGAGVQQRFSSRLSKLPARKDVWNVLSDSMEYFSELEKSYRRGMPVPAQRSYGIYKNTMWKLLRFVFNDKMDIRNVLERGQRIIDNKLSN